MIFVVCETVDDHDEDVMLVGGASPLNDAVGSRRDADMYDCSGKGGVDRGRFSFWELWLLFNNPTFSFSFSLSGTSRCDLTRLHQFANI